jgi:hypothetical protein
MHSLLLALASLLRQQALLVATDDARQQPTAG